MARDYVPKKNGLPDAVSRQVLWLVRDYARMKREYETIRSGGTPCLDGQPRSKKLSDVTGHEAVRRADLSRKLEAIEKARMEIPEEYRAGVWNHIQRRDPYPLNADRVTYWRYKAAFLYRVAWEMDWI